MKKIHWQFGLFLAAMGAASGIRAATVAVTITAQPETAYELNVSGIRKNGRLGPSPGSLTSRSIRRKTSGPPGSVIATARAISASPRRYRL